MRIVETNVTISAPASLVWDILVGFDGYAEWNPFMVKAAGYAEPGERLAITLRQSDTRTMSFKPKVLVAEPGKHLRWIGRLLVPGIFDGMHEFILTETGEGTSLNHKETFSGVLPALMGSKLDSTALGFEQFNQALKSRAESLHSATN
ncbi:SRPBCC domain-containing protein [Streptomyces sp. NEAU-S7GS2]|uniref:SRPBCC domain-containing protein n=1 Tax=Streptomyces sp. NEAU-S7GS2 TaxID=2202000 RepID=UPI000D701E10|nr:SRPBCC domain-containing protein [Streptomyces sp. NEAU-S7GS2]AWN27786.1 SRPBCC domain-containing protein [Streptomyces sp. NEAU-S7GS2]